MKTKAVTQVKSAKQVKIASPLKQMIKQLDQLNPQELKKLINEAVSKLSDQDLLDLGI